MRIEVDVSVENPIGYFSQVRTVTFAIPEGTRPGEYEVLVGFGGNDVDGILSPAAVAAATIDGVRAGRFMILPHGRALDHFRRKAEDYDRWISGMRKFRRRLEADS